MSDDKQNWYLVVNMNGIQAQPVKYATREEANRALNAALAGGRFDQVVEEESISKGNRMVMLLGPGATLMVMSERHMNAQRMMAQAQQGMPRIVPGRG